LKIPNIGKGGFWDLFEKAAKASGQPQRNISFAAEVFSACTVPPGSGMGAFHNL